jgi:isoleucyl-tRNA synthetase
MESYSLYRVVPEIIGFINELTNWYIRLSRRRFWGEGGKLSDSTREAYETLYHVLLGFSKIFAPFAPFIAEEIYRSLVVDHGQLPESVHLCRIPDASEPHISLELEKRMSLVARTTELGRSLRAKHQIKTRQVLRSMLVITRETSDQEAVAKSKAIVLSELNLKDLQFTTDESQYVNLAVKPNLRTLGPRLGANLVAFRKAFELEFSNFDNAQNLLDRLRQESELDFMGVRLSEGDLLIDRQSKDQRLIASEGGITVLLDTTLDDALVREGLARELVNRVQKMRKDAGLNVADRIRVKLVADQKIHEAVEDQEHYIKGETLTHELEWGEQKSESMQAFDIDGHACWIGITAL